MRVTSMITTSILGVLSASILVACGGNKGASLTGGEISISDGVEERKLAQNSDLKNEKCYAAESDGVELPDQPPVGSEVYFIKIDSSGAIRRYLPADQPGQRPLLSQINEVTAQNEPAAIVRLLGNVQLAELSPASTEGIPQGKTPLFSRIQYHTRLYYVLLNDNWEFVEDKFQPFEPINLIGTKVSAPYFEPANSVYRAGTHNVLTLDFYAPQKYVEKQDCHYSYNLNVYAKTPNSGGVLRTLLVIDPEHENQGDDSGGRD